MNYMNSKLTKVYLGAHLTVQDVPESLSVEKLSGTAMVPCFLCGDTMALSRMRNHIGHHILLSMRDIEDDKDLLQDVSVRLQVNEASADIISQT